MPASASSPRVRWDFDGSKLIDAITLLWLPCLLPRDPLGANLPFTIALFAFVLVAMANHLFPERRRSLTHVVKALDSVLLVLSTRVSPLYALPSS